MKERAELAEHNASNFQKEAERYKDENAKLVKVNQEYFLRLTANVPAPEEKKKPKPADDEKSATTASIVEELINKKK